MSFPCLELLNDSSGLQNKAQAPLQSPTASVTSLQTLRPVSAPQSHADLCTLLLCPSSSSNPMCLQTALYVTSVLTLISPHKATSGTYPQNARGLRAYTCFNCLCFSRTKHSAWRKIKHIHMSEQMSTPCSALLTFFSWKSNC